MLKEQEALRRWLSSAASTEFRKRPFYNWKVKHGGMEVSEAKRLKALEEENAKLKKMLSKQMLGAAVLRELLQCYGLPPGVKPSRI
ncbi:transposase [Sinorhizobium medicae]|uniref:transposase n=1 Tax=Sinorhizobium medicae TaxID=110321 RepID=UPI002E118487|nr:transposase [Sinorhizobium medicae]